MWTLLLIASVPAYAQDAHGPVPPPNDVDPMDPVLVWSPRVPDAGPSAAFFATFAESPLVHESKDDGSTVTEALLDDVVTGNLTFSYGFGRAGLGVSLPVVMALSGTHHGFGVGAARIAAPILLTTPGATGSVTVTPFVKTPTLGSARLRPNVLPTGGLAVAGGTRHDRWAADASLQASVDVAEAGFTPTFALGGGFGWAPVERVALRLDLNVYRPLAGRFGGQAAVWLQAEPSEGLRLFAGGGPGLGKSIGTPTYLAMIGVGWSQPAGVRRRPAPERELPAVSISVTDPNGQGLPGAGVWIDEERVATADLRGLIQVPALRSTKRAPPEVRAPGYLSAPMPSGAVATLVMVPASVPLRLKIIDDKGTSHPEVELRGPPGVDPPRLIAGLDGFAASMRPGQWTLLVHASDRSQERDINVEPGRTDPIIVEVVLGAPGAGSMVMRVLDYGGHPVEGATVQIDGHPLGTTGSAGTIRARAPAGKHTIVATAPGYASTRLETTSDDATLRVPYQDGALLVVALGPDTRPVDAVIRFEGPQRLPPVRLGSDGRGVFQLAPGAWTVFVESAALGPQRRSLLVPSTPSPGVIDLPLLLRPTEAGPATLDVRVIDADGNPVPEASISLDGAALGTTSTGGGMAVEALRLTPRKLTVSAEGFATLPVQEIVLAPGYQEQTVLLPYPEGTVEVTATDARGAPADALIRLAGPARLAPTQLGSDGKARFQLAPGHWQMLASSSAFGNQTRDFDVPRGPGGLIRVDLKMRATGVGSAELVLKVLGPDALPVNGAEVLIDGDSLGTTSNTGQMQSSGLTGGAHEIQVHAEAYKDVKYTLTLKDGVAKNGTVALDYAPGATRLQVRGSLPTGGEVPVRDAILRLSGPRNLTPVRVDASGERLFSLEPGEWQALVSSETYGIEQKSFQVGAVDGLQQIPLLLASPKSGEATLLVRVSDLSGQPIRGASVKLGTAAATTSAGGAALLSGLSLGSAQIAVAAPGYMATTPPSFSLVPGSQTQFVTLDHLRQEVAITVVDPQGHPVDANIGFTGVEYVSSRNTGEDGVERVALRPGIWTVDVEADYLKPQSVKIIVPAEQAPVPVTIKLNR